MVKLPTAKEVRAALKYDPATGVFIRRYSLRKRYAGVVVGTVNRRGYVVIQLLGRLHYAHRLAWLITHGYWPVVTIDHVNGVRHDNRIANLREATTCENLRNSKRRRDNTSGYKGVGWCQAANKWRAYIGTAPGSFRHLGVFKTKEDAAAAYAAAAAIHHKEFMRLK